MTNGEKAAILQAVERINSLASLENAGFSFSKEEDAKIKEKIRPYMMWFESVAFMLEDLANAEDKYDRQTAIDKIHRYCH